MLGEYGIPNKIKGESNKGCLKDRKKGRKFTRTKIEEKRKRSKKEGMIPRLRSEEKKG
jgi:hypothetical protein